MKMTGRRHCFLLFLFFFFFFLSFLCDSANREICDERILEGPWRSLAGSLKAFLEKKSKKWERLLQVKKNKKTTDLDLENHRLIALLPSQWQLGGFVWLANSWRTHQTCNLFKWFTFLKCQERKCFRQKQQFRRQALCSKLFFYQDFLAWVESLSHEEHDGANPLSLFWTGAGRNVIKQFFNWPFEKTTEKEKTMDCLPVKWIHLNPRPFLEKEGEPLKIKIKNK